MPYTKVTVAGNLTLRLLVFFGCYLCHLYIKHIITHVKCMNLNIKLRHKKRTGRPRPTTKQAMPASVKDHNLHDRLALIHLDTIRLYECFSHCWLEITVILLCSIHGQFTNLLIHRSQDKLIPQHVLCDKTTLLCLSAGW